MPVPRTFKPYTATTTAAPLVGTTFTQQIIPSPNVQTVKVNDSSMFVKNDAVICMAASGGTVTELVTQIQVISSTSISAIFSKQHASGEFVILSHPCANVNVQGTLANPPTGFSLWLGNSYALTTAGVNAFHDLGVSMFFTPPSAGWGNPDNTANYWVCTSSGTAGYLPSAWQNAG